MTIRGLYRSFRQLSIRRRRQGNARCRGTGREGGRHRAPTGRRRCEPGNPHIPKLVSIQSLSAVWRLARRFAFPARRESLMQRPRIGRAHIQS